MWFRKRLTVRIVAAVMAVVLALSAGYLFIEVSNAKKAATEAITSYGIRLSENYAQQLDTSKIEQFMGNQQENELYWNIRQECSAWC